MAGSTTAHAPPRRSWRVLGKAGLIALALAAAVSTAWLTGTDQAQAQSALKGGLAGKGLLKKRDPNAQMLVQATEIQYDYANERVVASGHVRIYYSDSTLEADRVVYDQKTKRLRAEGNVRLKEADGRVTFGEIIDLTDDFRDGFVDSLRLDAPDKTRFAATRADRTEGNYTVFQSGVYTACEACKDDPKKPPFWQVKAARIIHNEQEKMIYFESGWLEFWGLPVMYFPYMSAPDPTVKRKSGFLMPDYWQTTNVGPSFGVPYFWALAPNYDVTLTPTITTRQGFLGQAEWRHRLVNGAYVIRGTGIFQTDPDKFGTEPGNRDFRGAIETNGQFNITDRWLWGWDGTVMTDKTFWSDYRLWKHSPTLTQGNFEATSQLYLMGRGDQSFFDARFIYYYGLTAFDDQRQIPVVHPVIDYEYKFGRPVFGGELGYRFNLTSLSRNDPDWAAINQAAVDGALCTMTSADPAARLPANCVLRGAPGSYTRLSGEVNWRRTIIDRYGQVFTPFVNVRADVAAVNIQPDLGVGNFVQSGDSMVFRGMPAVGLEYRYPWISAHSWGTQTIEPIVQVIARPNESQVGKLPNEDAQGLIFSDANLFNISKFSGWDRVEGGGRANVGLSYTAQLDRGGWFNVLFGQSYHLFGDNSYALADAVNTGLGSGLDTSRSDYVARMSFQPNQTFLFSTRFRFDEQTFDVRRTEIEGRVFFDRWTLTGIYGNYDAQPEIGLLSRREAVVTTATYKLNTNWTLNGGMRYDLENGRLGAVIAGIGYVDDCFSMALTYARDYGYGGATTANETIGVTIALRTLGATNYTQHLTGTSSAATSNPFGLGGL